MALAGCYRPEYFLLMETIESELESVQRVAECVVVFVFGRWNELWGFLPTSGWLDLAIFVIGRSCDELWGWSDLYTKGDSDPIRACEHDTYRDIVVTWELSWSCRSYCGHAEAIVPQARLSSCFHMTTIAPVWPWYLCKYCVHTLWLDQNVACDHNTSHMHDIPLMALNKKPHSSISSARVGKWFVALE